MRQPSPCRRRSWPGWCRPRRPARAACRRPSTLPATPYVFTPTYIVSVCLIVVQRNVLDVPARRRGPHCVIHAGWAMCAGSFSCRLSVMTTTPGLVAGLKSLATFPVKVIGSAETDRAPRAAASEQARAEHRSAYHDEAPSSVSSFAPFCPPLRAAGSLGTTTPLQVAAEPEQSQADRHRMNVGSASWFTPPGPPGPR